MRGAVGARILVTGMSGAGKSSLLRVLASRGITTVDTDYGGYVEADGRWNDERIRALLDAHSSIVVSGTVENQGDYYDRFDRVVLLSAPLDVLLARVAARTDNPYGQTEEERNEIRRHVAEVEPLLRRGAHVELDGTRPLTDLADAVERFLHPGPVEVRDAVFPRDLSSVSALLEGYLVQTEREKADHGLVAPSDELPERYARAIEDPESAFRGARVMLASVEGEDCGIIVMTRESADRSSSASGRLLRRAAGEPEPHSSTPRWPRLPHPCACRCGSGGGLRSSCTGGADSRSSLPPPRGTRAPGSSASAEADPHRLRAPLRRRSPDGRTFLADLSCRAEFSCAAAAGPVSPRCAFDAAGGRGRQGGRSLLRRRRARSHRCSHPWRRDRHR